MNKPDRDKLDEYLSSVRDVEQKLGLDRHWQKIPKPKTDLPEPVNQGLVRDLPAIYDLIALALQTDSTRVATLEIGGSFAASDLGIRNGYHSLSHHGQLQSNIELKSPLTARTDQFARCLTEKLLAYSLGRTLEPFDRPHVNRIVATAKAKGYGLRDLVLLVAQSEPFQSK